MKTILAAGLLTFLQLNIFFLTGCGAAGLFERIRKRKSSCETGSYSFGYLFFCGFCTYHTLFWFLACPWSILDLPLHILILLWLIILILLLVFSAAVSAPFSLIRRGYLSLIDFIRKNALFAAACAAVCGFVSLYAILHAVPDIDAQTYIGEITTMLHADRISRFSPATGLPQTRADLLRRGISLFGAESAFWCRLSGLHPLVYCHTVRAVMNHTLLLSGIYHLMRRLGASARNALLFDMLCSSFFFMTAKGLYANAQFMLTRAYENKAYLAGTLIVLTIVMCAEYLGNRDVFSFLMLFASGITCVSISASSQFVIPFVTGVMMLSYAILRRTWKLLPLTALLMIPYGISAAMLLAAR